MKVVCIDVYEGGRMNKDLTLGKTYEVICRHTTAQAYAVMNDKGSATYYSKRMFNTIAQIREEKLNQIL